MLEAIAIPILVKAVDFLFEEGRKILEERRERRRTEDEKQKLETTIAQPSPPRQTEAKDKIQSKEAALSAPVAETTWRGSEVKVKHIMSMLEIYTRNYYLAKEQYAKFGSAFVPPIIVNNLIEAEDGIATTTKELQTVLSQVYGKTVTVTEVEQE